jgi:polysaccharide export outer membrane protein
MKRSSWSIHIALFAGLISVVVVMGSCGSTRELTYLQGQFDTLKLSQVQYPVPLIQKNDILGITVYSDDPKASAYYNLPTMPTVYNTGTTNAPSTVNSPSASGSSYLVDEQGYIQMPGIGKLQVAGLTKLQLDTLIISKIKDKLQNPYLIIRMNSYKITMLGEVSRPGQFTIPNERVSLLEAIALAGDLTTFGRRENILVIREINGGRAFQRLNLKDPEILNSPYFYLQPNDVVVVDPNKQKSAANDVIVVRNISLAVSLISVLAVIITLTRTK